MKFQTLVLTLLSVWCGASARCVMRKDCYEVGGFDKPCPVDMEAPPLIDDTDPEERAEILAIFRDRCPSLTVDENGNDLPDEQIRTCCDAKQIRKMSDSFMLSDGLLARCPTCSKNFIRQICEMNCSPDQSRFVDVYKETGTNNTLYVNEIDYRVHADFMERAHASCIGVLHPQTGLPVIYLMCGLAIVCDDEAWFGFTGDTTANPLAPVQVNFLKRQTEEDSMNAVAPLCHETFAGDFPCSCGDCISLCSSGNEPSDYGVTMVQSALH